MVVLPRALACWSGSPGLQRQPTPAQRRNMLPCKGAGFLRQVTAHMTCVCRCYERVCAATQAPAAVAPAAFSISPVLVCGETCSLAMARSYDLYMAGALTGV